jgi:hypothetical protein
MVYMEVLYISNAQRTEREGRKRSKLPPCNSALFYACAHQTGGPDSPIGRGSVLDFWASRHYLAELPVANRVGQVYLMSLELRVDSNTSINQAFLRRTEVYQTKLQKNFEQEYGRIYLKLLSEILYRRKTSDGKVCWKAKAKIVYKKNAYLVSRRKYPTKERFEMEAPCFVISEAFRIYWSRCCFSMITIADVTLCGR